MTKLELAKLIAKYERKLKLAKTRYLKEGEVIGFEKASKIQHYCKSCGKLLKERR